MMPSRFYGALLRLYPTSFRQEYAAELHRAYEQSVRDRGPLRAAIGAVGDVLPNAIAAHWEIFAQDARYATRTLTRSRGFATATIVVTALGVGANTATFSVADFVLVRPLPFPHPAELVRLCSGQRDVPGWGCMNQLSPAVYRDVVAQSRSFSSIGVYTGASVNLVEGGDPLRVNGYRVTPEVMSLLGVKPLVGRAFEKTGDEQAVVLSYGLWRSRFAGATDIVGSRINVSGTPHTVIGVMPADFRYPNGGAQIWLPFPMDPQSFQDRNNTYLDGIARLKPGVSFEQAAAELDGLARRFEHDYPADHPKFSFSFFRLSDEVWPRNRTILLSLCGASLCILLLTCANLANLGLARAQARERELAVRAALGAGRERLIRQMMTESVALALAGGIAGALLAAVAAPFLTRLVPTGLPIASAPTLDLRVLSIGLAFAAFTGLGFGLLPALRVAGASGFAALRETRRSARRRALRSTLVAVEVAVSVALLVSSGLLIRAIWKVRSIDPGFVPANVLTLRTVLPSPEYDDSVRREAFYDRVLSTVGSLPGVEAAAYTSGLPMVMWGGIGQALLTGEENKRDGTQNVSWRVVSPDLFKALSVPLRQGRVIENGDRRGTALVAVVSESFAAQRLPGVNPIGQTFQFRNEVRSIVGVVGDIKVRGLERQSEPQIYMSYHQPPPGVPDFYQPKDLVVRAPNAMALVPAVREAIRSVDAKLPISDVRELSDVIEGQTETRSAQIQVLGALALLALLVSGVGIHGLLSFTVAQRDREIGVRLALGAERGEIARLVIAEGVRTALIGLIPGVLIAYLAARAMGSLLFGVPPTDPITIGAVAFVCFATAAIGCVRPAIRAARIDPISALRSD